MIIKLNNELRLDAEVLEGNEVIGADFFLDYDFTGCGSWDGIEERAWDILPEYIDGLVPIYYNKIDSQFNELTDMRIDELVYEFSIELGNDFSKFKQAVLYWDMYQIASEELGNALEEIEEIVVDIDSVVEAVEDALDEDDELRDLDLYDIVEFLIERDFFIDRESFNDSYEDSRLLSKEMNDIIRLIDYNYIY